VGLLAQILSDARSRRPDDLALFERAAVGAQVEEIDSHHAVVRDESLCRGECRVGRGGVGKNLAFGHRLDPRAVLPIKHCAVLQTVGSEHLGKGRGHD
jgi:hypothetical protein